METTMSNNTPPVNTKAIELEMRRIEIRVTLMLRLAEQHVNHACAENRSGERMTLLDKLCEAEFIDELAEVADLLIARAGE
jgi:hypothetical protein